MLYRFFSRTRASSGLGLAFLFHIVFSSEINLSVLWLFLLFFPGCSEFGSQYHSYWLRGKTRPRNDLLCFDWD